METCQTRTLLFSDSTDAKCMCIGCPESNCVTHKFSKSYDSAKALFSAGYIRDETVKRDEILKAFWGGARFLPRLSHATAWLEHQVPRQQLGSMGFLLQLCPGCQNSDSNDADASIGIGLVQVGPSILPREREPAVLTARLTSPCGYG